MPQSQLSFHSQRMAKIYGQLTAHKKTCPNLPKDTLGAIELTQQVRELLKKDKTRKWDANMVFGDEAL